MVKGRKNDSTRTITRNPDGTITESRAPFEEGNPAWQSNSKVGSRRRIFNKSAIYTWKYKHSTGGLERKNLKKEIVKGYRGAFNRQEAGPNIENIDSNAPNVIKRRIKSKNASKGALEKNDWVKYIKTAQSAWFQRFQVPKGYPAIIADPVIQLMYHAATKLDGLIKASPVLPSIYPFVLWSDIEAESKRQNKTINWDSIVNRDRGNGVPAVQLWNPFDVIDNQKSPLYVRIEKLHTDFFGARSPKINFRLTEKIIVMEDEEPKPPAKKNKRPKIRIVEQEENEDQIDSPPPLKRKRQSRPQIEEDDDILSPVYSETGASSSSELVQLLSQLTVKDTSSIGDGHENTPQISINIKLELKPSANMDSDIFNEYIKDKTPPFYYLQSLYRMFPFRSRDKLVWLDNWIINIFCQLVYSNTTRKKKMGIMGPLTFQMVYTKAISKKVRNAPQQVIEKSTFLQKLENGIIVIPDTQTQHWLTLLFELVLEEDEASIQVTIYDSFQTSSKKKPYITEIIQKFSKMVEWATEEAPPISSIREGFKITGVSFPKQNDGSSCGVFALRFMELLNSDTKVTTEKIKLSTPSQIIETRANMANRILRNSSIVNSQELISPEERDVEIAALVPKVKKQKNK